MVGVLILGESVVAGIWAAALAVLVVALGIAVRTFMSWGAVVKIVANDVFVVVLPVMAAVILGVTEAVAGVIVI